MARDWPAGYTWREDDTDSARASFAACAADRRNELPLYRAHMWADLSSVAVDADSADQHRGQALSLYRRLGAAPYVSRLEAGMAADAEPRTVVDLGLTDREREVLALLVRGISYRQIAGQLYVHHEHGPLPPVQRLRQAGRDLTARRHCLRDGQPGDSVRLTGTAGQTCSKWTGCCARDAATLGLSLTVFGDGRRAGRLGKRTPPMLVPRHVSLVEPRGGRSLPSPQRRRSDC